MEKNNQVINLFFSLIKSEICNKKLDNDFLESVSSQQLEKLFALAKAHDVAHLIAYALNKRNFLTQDEISKKFQNQLMLSVYRYEGINYELKSFCEILESKKIAFVPLKGAIIKKYYPEEWMRTSCDIDILISEQELKKATDVLLNDYNYTYEKESSHDISIYSPNKVHIELHYTLIEDSKLDASAKVLQNIWDNVNVCEGCSYCYEMSDEMFYFYHIAHMAKHFEEGGCGVKPFLDLWFLDNLQQVDINKRNELLEKGKLLKFANVCRKLSRIWFENEEYDSVSKQTEQFILNGGVYGSHDNRIAVQQHKKGGRFKYAMFKIFPPYRILKFHYPVLQKHRFLMPFMQVRRWCKLIFCGHLKRSTRELKSSNKISTEQAIQMQKFLNDVGLK